MNIIKHRRTLPGSAGAGNTAAGNTGAGNIKANSSPARHIVIALFISVFAGVTQNSYAESVITEFTAHYKVIKGGITVGDTKRSVALVSENNYEFRSETVPRGIFNWISDAYVLERSIWRLDNSDFRPLEYHYQNFNDDMIRDVKLLFDWNKQRVTNIINGDPWHMTLQSGLLDKLLFQLKMMQDLSNGVEVLEYSVADGGKIKEYKIEKIGRETLEIDLGKFETVKMQRVTKSKTTMWWCAEQLHYLPIKIQQQRPQGKRVVAELYELEGIALPEPSAASPKPSTTP